MKLFKSKKSLIIKFMALFIAASILLPMSFACGEKPADNKAATTAGDTSAEAATPQPTPPPTTPEPTEPPTTEAPTEPFVPDPNQTYWEQIKSELEWYGLKDGTPVFTTESEAALMKKFGVSTGKKEELDVSGDGVPFSAAYRVTIAKDTANFWDAAYTCNLMKDIPVALDDMIVGVVWIRGARIAETDNFVADDPAEYYLALKTPTNNWSTEGDMVPTGEQFAEQGWQKVFFCGRVLVDETNSSNLSFQIFLGYGNQQVDVGGIVAYKYTWSNDNEKALWKLIP